jgi:anti-sigma B factor antagonist
VASHLEISQREREGIVIQDLKGRLVVGDAATAVREAITRCREEGKNRIILNLQNVDYIDSSGLGALVICFTSLQRASGALKLTNLNRRNIELLVLTKLSTVFEVFDNEDDAVNSFFPEREIRRFDILSFVQQQEREQES